MKNFFEVFNIRPIRLVIDKSLIESRYRELVFVNHPDRSRAQESLELISDINLAYKALSNVWNRAEHFLQLKSIKLSSEVPKELAELYFSMQECSLLEELKKVEMDLSLEQQKLESQLNSLFLLHDQEGAQSHVLEQLSKVVSMHRFLSSMQNDLSRRLLEIV